MAAAEAVAADEIRVVALEIGGREYGAAENGRSEAGRIALDDADDAITRYAAVRFPGGSCLHPMICGSGRERTAFTGHSKGKARSSRGA